MFAQLIYVYAGERARYAWFGGILLGYWAMLTLIPVPGCGAGVLTMECSFAGYVDRLLVPGHLYRDVHDPEGLLSTLPAICNALLGIFAGTILRTDGRVLSQNQKTSQLAVYGLICLLVGLMWGVFFPINKNLWTSSFMLVTGGLSLLLLALFYWIIDVKGFTRWTFFFTVIGMNSILIYMAGNFIDFGYTAKALFGGLLGLIPSEPFESPWRGSGLPGRSMGLPVLYVEEEVVFAGVMACIFSDL